MVDVIGKCLSWDVVSVMKSSKLLISKNYDGVEIIEFV